jgi:hypothetical protein
MTPARDVSVFWYVPVWVVLFQTRPWCCLGDAPSLETVRDHIIVLLNDTYSTMVVAVHDYVGVSPKKETGR